MKGTSAHAILTHADIERLRHRRGSSILLFVTDRCPVGCAHCSVDSRRDSPTIRDFDLFGQIVDCICRASEIEVVGLSGGEPFAERRGLELAVAHFAAAGKRQVVFTSGVWGRAASTPRWVREVLASCACVYLSTDAFHARTVDDRAFERAARAVVSQGVWLVVQVLDQGDAIASMERTLANTLGADWREWAEVNAIAPLTSGRGASQFVRIPRTSGDQFGACPLARGPMVRYDGVVTACCNESVIVGRGPKRLRITAGTGDEVAAAMQRFHEDPLLRLIGDVGFGTLTTHPRLRDLAPRRFANNCDLCWQVMDRLPERDTPDALIDVMYGLTSEAL